MRGSIFWISVRGRCGRRGVVGGRRTPARGFGGRRRLLVPQDHLPRVGKLLALEERLKVFSVDVRVITFHAHTEGLHLEDEVLVGDPHHRGEVLDANLSHIFSVTPLMYRCPLVFPEAGYDSLSSERTSSAFSAASVSPSRT